MRARAWVVIPTYNEAANVERIVREADSELERIMPGEHRILVVDDNSPDGTGAIADALAAGAELLIEMDADFSHDPRYLPDLVGASSEADLVLGSRYVPGGGVRDWGLVRRMISRGGGVYARAILRVDVHDLTGGFKCIRREVLKAIDLDSVRADGYVFQIEVTYRASKAGFTVKEIPIVFQDRTVGSSKMSPRIALEAMWLVPRLRRSAATALARSTADRDHVETPPAPERPRA